MTNLKLSRILMGLLLLIIQQRAHAQSTIILSEGFDNGITPPAGWTFRGMGTYTTAAASGSAIPSLRFDDTNDQVITATFSQADSLAFWLKGYSTDAASALVIDVFRNGSWSKFTELNNISTSGTSLGFALPAATTQLRFTYQKSAGNLAFDDLRLFAFPKPQAALFSGNQALSSNSSFNFGTVTIGQPRQQSFTLRNNGNTTLHNISTITNGEFSISQHPAGSIQPGDSTHISVTFNPTMAGIRNGSLNITSNAGTYTLNLSGTGLAGSAVYNNFNYQNGDIRSTAPGVIASGSNTNLEQFMNGSWSTISTLPAQAKLYILHQAELQGQHTIQAVTVAPQAQFNLAAGSSLTTTHMLVKSGGAYLVNSNWTNTGTFEAEAEATVEISHAFTDPASQIWLGTENFHPNSNLVIRNWNATKPLAAANYISANSSGYLFGNLTISTNFSTSWTLTEPGTTYLTAGNFVLEKSGSQGINLSSEGVFSLFFGKTLQIQSGILRLQQAQNGQAQVHVKENLVMNGGTLQLNNQNSSAASAILILEGSLAASTSAEFTNVNILNLSGTGIWFRGTATQVLDAAAAFTSVPLVVKPGAQVQLSQNLNLHPSGLINAGTFTVENGATLDFGFNPSGNGNIISGNGYFRLEQGGQLIVTSPEGIAASGATGNVQVPDNRRSFANAAIYHYAGKAAQQTGTGLPATSSGKILIINNPATVTLSQNTGISNNTAISADGGRLEIRQGEFITGQSGDVTSSGKLVMYGGVFKSFTQHTTVPQLSGSYDLRGGAVELAANGPQTLRGGGNYPYFNLIVSGNNTAGVDFKTISTATTVKNQLELKNNAILDIGNRTLSGDGGLKMSGGLLRIGKTTGVLPELAGNATAYELSGGTIEMYGTSGSQSQSVRGSFGSGNDRLSYHNLLISSNAVAGSSFDVNGTLTVNSGGTFSIASNRSIGGNGNFVLQKDATLNYGAAEGISRSGTDLAAGNIRVAGMRFYSTEANYGLIGALDMSTGNGLPAQVKNLSIDKSSGHVTITNPVQVNGVLSLANGIVNTRSHELFLANPDSSALKNYSDKAYVNGNFRRSIGGNLAYYFPVGSAQALRLLVFQPEDLSGNGFSSVAAAFLQKNENQQIQVQQGDVYYGSLSPEGSWVLQADKQPESGGYTLYLSTSGFGSIAGMDYILLNKPAETASWGAAGTTAARMPETYTVPGEFKKHSGLTTFGEFAFGLPGGQPLPVSWLSFTGRQVQQHVLLNWQTVCEIDNKNFRIERSADGNYFSTLGEIAGAGNSREVHSYSFLDEQPLNGTSYYRIRQTDWSGTESFTPIIAVAAQRNNLVSYNLYPNPAEHAATLSIEAPETEQAYIKIFDATGRQVHAEKVVLKPGLQTFRLPVAHLPAGIYYVSVSGKKEARNLKLIKR